VGVPDDVGRLIVLSQLESEGSLLFMDWVRRSLFIFAGGEAWLAEGDYRFLNCVFDFVVDDIE